jgi:hypothetical protein
MISPSPKIFASPQRESKPLDSISGHVYNAGTHLPIAGATVVLQDKQSFRDTTTRTAKDGSYSFRNIDRGLYAIAAYADQFLGQFLGDRLDVVEIARDRKVIAVGSSLPQKNLIVVGKDATALNFFLHSVEAATAINDEPIAATLIGKLNYTQTFLGRFSPDGTLLALATTNGNYGQQVWLYDIRSGRMTPATDLAGGMVKLAWSSNGTLYIRRDLNWTTLKAGEKPPVRFTAVTTTSIRDVKQLPPEISKVFDSEHRYVTTQTVPGLAERFFDENDKYVVTLAAAHGNAPFLIIEPKSPTGRRRVLQGSGPSFSYVFDKVRSEVIYPKADSYDSQDVTILHLQTGRSTDLFFRRAVIPLDRSPDGSLLAVSVYGGECQPDESRSLRFLHLERPVPPTPNSERPQYHACLVKIPNNSK